MTKRRVVITGIGAITPYGVGASKLWNGVVNGQSAISKIENMGDMTGHSVLIAGEIKESTFNPVDYFEPKEARRLDKYLQYAIVAAKEAVEDSGIKNSDIDPFRFGVIVGSAAGGFNTIQKSYYDMMTKGPTKCSPFTIPMLITDMGAGKISIELGAKGVNKAVVSACATSAHCIGDAFRSIQYGDADAVVTGGSEAVICTIGLGSFTAAKTLSKRNDEPTKASRPYDKDRDGFVMSEGAGILVLEELEHAKKRGAKIILRGLRAVSDFEYEMQLSQANSALSSDIKTIFMITKPKYNFISSSTIKEIHLNNGDISKFVPECVFEYLKNKK